MREKYTKIESDKILIVEGKDEEHFFKAFLKSIKEDHGVQILSVGGKTNISKKYISALKNTPDFSNVRQLGIIRDADESAQSAFQSIRDILKHNNFPVPQQPGLPVTSHSLTVSVFILPDNKNPGMLEDLCREVLRTQDVDVCIRNYLDCMRKIRSLRTFKNEAKAWIYAYLAVQERERLRLGEFTEAGGIPFEHDKLQGLRNFLTTLFQLQ